MAFLSVPRYNYPLPCLIYLPYACERTLGVELQRRIQAMQAMEMRCYRKILRISNKKHVTNEEVCAQIQQAIGPHEDLLAIVKRRKLRWYGRVSRSLGLAKTILRGTVKGGKKTRQTEKEVERQRQRMDSPGVRQVPQRAMKNWKKWRRLAVKLSVVPKRPVRLRNRRSEGDIRMVG